MTVEAQIAAEVQKQLVEQRANYITVCKNAEQWGMFDKNDLANVSVGTRMAGPMRFLVSSLLVRTQHRKSGVGDSTRRLWLNTQSIAEMVWAEHPTVRMDQLNAIIQALEAQYIIDANDGDSLADSWALSDEFYQWFEEIIGAEDAMKTIPNLSETMNGCDDNKVRVVVTGPPIRGVVNLTAAIGLMLREENCSAEIILENGELIEDDPTMSKLTLEEVRRNIRSMCVYLHDKAPQYEISALLLPIGLR